MLSKLLFVVATFQMVVSAYAAAPNDPYFASSSLGTPYFQWGMHSMRFPAAWDVTPGHAYIGVIDGGVMTGTESGNNADIDFSIPPPDVNGTTAGTGNFRKHFSLGKDACDITNGAICNSIHGTHVVGIIGAIANTTGVSGGCQRCSVFIRTAGDLAHDAGAIRYAVDRGAQIINYSRNSAGTTCPTDTDTAKDFCAAVAYAELNDVLVVASAGNTYDQPTAFPATIPEVLSVGGTEPGPIFGISPPNWAFWRETGTVGSRRSGTEGVVAPAQSIISTVSFDTGFYSIADGVPCGDKAGIDQSVPPGASPGDPPADGFGTCSGTSMAAPHVTALAGLIRSINPRLTRAQVAEIIRSSGSQAIFPTPTSGHGLPDARTAVNKAVNQTPGKLTPLFALYSSLREDLFYTTVPQMAVAATKGSLLPAIGVGSFSGIDFVPTRYKSAIGSAGTVSGYTAFPGVYTNPSDSPGANQPRAAVWLFTTPQNPKNASVPLTPLYRLSWKCPSNGYRFPIGHPKRALAPTVCDAKPDQPSTYNTDTAYAVHSELSFFMEMGYSIDGIEGYVYPKVGMTQPLGTVKLMRRYKPEVDDFNLFPDTQTAAWDAVFYNDTLGLDDWVGYVYPSGAGGTRPVIQ